MLGIHDLPLFVVAGLMLNVTPGPDTLYIVGRSTTQGFRAGATAALGIGTGALVHITAATVGLSALLAASAAAFAAVKWLGATYLVYVGVTMLHTSVARRQGQAIEQPAWWAAPRHTIFMQAFFTNVLNPKVEMKKVVLMLLSLSCLLPWTMTSAQGSGAESDIRDLNSREVQALLRRDVETLKRLWSDDFVVTNPFSKFVRRHDVLDMVRSNRLAFSSYERQVEYVRVYRDNTMAVVAGSETVVWAGKMPTAGQTSRLRFTGVWLRQGGRWQQVARHASIVASR